MSIPEVVKEIITRNRSIFDCFKMNMINYTALAIKIQPDIEKNLGSSVNRSTIIVAIKRYADTIKNKEKNKDKLVLKNARLTLTGGMMDVKFSIKDSNQTDPMTIFNKLSKVTNNYEFFKFSDSFRFLVEDIDSIRQIFNNIPERDDMFSTGLAKIKITIPISQNQSGVVSYVAEILHVSGVELINAFFSQDNIIIILNEEDSSRAFDILNSDILKKQV